jgi:hypothetical protein
MQTLTDLGAASCRGQALTRTIYSNLNPHVSAVMSSDSVRGYFLQLRGRTG